MSVWDQLKRLDAYPKTLDDFRVKTYAGATVTIVSAILMCVLFVSELNYYLTVDTNANLVVDVSREEQMNINFNISFPRLPCVMISVDVLDVAGDHQSDIVHDIFKVRLRPDGTPTQTIKEQLGDNTDVVAALPENYCGSCYGSIEPPSGCCNTCEEVREAYRKKGWSLMNIDQIEQCKREGVGENIRMQTDEGCNIHGHVVVNKVAGNFHFAPGKSFQANHMHVHDINSLAGMLKGKKFDMTHVIHRLSFGQDFPDIFNPLDGSAKASSENAQMAYQYFIKIVPTGFVYLNGTKINTNQFSFTRSESNMLERNGGLPGVFFNFDISPMRVIYRQSSRSFFHFLTGVCAIVGGIFSVAGLVDGFIYTANRSLKKKIQLGKAS